MTDITLMSVEQTAKMIESRELSPLDLVEACLARIEKLNPILNAYLCVTADSARARAREMEKEIAEGHYRGKLHGIPVSLKDMYYTKGIPTTAGSRVLDGFIPDYDSTVAQRLAEAGAILLGKNNTAEFAIGATTAECYFGPSRNPWNTVKITGGSSGGSAVATVTGMAYIAMGTDTGGSIRIPSSLCGNVGFKPSLGRISLYGIIPCGINYDCAGPLCRSVADAAIALDAITGTDEKDPSPYAISDGPTHFYDYIAGVQNLKGKVFGVPDNSFFKVTDYEVEEIFNATVERFKALGADVRRIAFPLDLEKVNAVSTCGMFCEAAWTHREWRATSKNRYQTGTDLKLDIGSEYKAADYIQTLSDRKELMAAWETAMKNYDAIVVPTCPVTAFDIEIGRPWTITTRGQSKMGEPMLTWHTRLASVIGGPALSIPMELSKAGLPAGIMILGGRNQDRRVLEIGLAYERNYQYPTLPG